MKRRAPVGVADSEVMDGLVRFAPVDGGRWTVDGFGAWLEARAQWRASSGAPLPSLWALERSYARLNAARLTTELVLAEQTTWSSTNNGKVLR